MAWMLILLFIVVAVGCCLAGYFLSKKQVNLAFLSIGVDYFQILAIFANSKVSYLKLNLNGPCELGFSSATRVTQKVY
jgi:hypothetical protein